MKSAAVTAALLAALSSLSAQEVVVGWEFNRDGDTEGWLPAHSLSPLVVAGGVLRTRVTGPDPYMHSSAGQSFSLQGNDFQYIEIRMRETAGLGAEFFWANTVEGRDAGFVAGKERGFPCAADNEWHVYRVYPLWQGQVTRLRLDPPEGENAVVEIDYLRVVQGPVSSHDPKSPVWDLAQGNGGWVAQSGGTLLAATPEGAATELTAEVAVLVGPRVDLRAQDYQYAYLELRTSGKLEGNLYWSATEDANFPGCNAVSFEAAPPGLAGNLSVAQNPMYGGDLRRLQLSLKGKPGTKVTLRQVALSPKPFGPARLKVVSFAAAEALAALGRDARLVARLENLGGEELRGAQLQVTVTQGPVRLVGETAQTLRSVAPGGAAEASWAFRPTGEGRAKLRLSGPGGLAAETDVIACRPFPTPKSGPEPAAEVAAGGAWIGNDRVLLTLVKGPTGLACGRLDAIADGKPRAMALLPHLAQLAVAGSEEFADLALQEAKAERRGQEAALALTGSTQVGAAKVKLALTFTLRKGKSYLDVAYRLSADQSLKVTAFRGPWLWAGEGSFGDQQDLALFPGSEYLVKGERSSSTLDIAPPMNVRFAPHPNTVTVPSMAVEKGGAIVGVMWDPLQKWDGEHQKPTAVFASPNFLEGRANHLLGLCLPSAPDWLQPNELLAAKPYELRAGRPLALSACLYAEAPSAVLRSLDLYFDRFGLPELPPKPRSYEDTLAMCLKAYEDILWVEKAKGWMGVVGWAPGLSQGSALDYVTASRLLRDRAWAEKLTQKGLALADPSDLGFALHRFGAPCGALTNVLGSGRLLARRAPADGKYVFEPDEQRRSLGAAGSTAVGICADRVTGLLTNALRTGDREPLEAALKTLRYMERFEVPRASQVWEVPVHTPDILASGNACSVYLMAYKLTGDRHWLDRAAYWAKTGLPFVYMWQAPDQKPLMKGASIAVFGGTFYVGSWFARPVQWNGLAYARSLLELAKHDQSLPWRHLAEMITISGMNQQSTRPKDYGCYTDNWGVIDGVECTGCMLSPGGIMDNVLELLDAPAGVRTEVVRDSGRPVCITSAPVISDPQLAEGVLRLGLRYEPGQAAWTAVMPVAEPTRVVVDGADLPKGQAGIEGAEGWSYRASVGCLTLKLRYDRKAPRAVQIVGAKAIAPTLPSPGWEFDGGSTEGWAGAHDVAPLGAKDGRLIIEVTGGDPYLYGPAFEADAAEYPGIVFRARATAPNGQLFFATDSGGFGEARSRAFTLPADGAFHEVRMDLRDHPEWKGTITQFRLDFAGPPCHVEIDWVRMLKAGG